MVVSENGTTIQLVTEDIGNPVAHESFSLAPVGFDPHLTRTCSTKKDAPVPYSSYTATATTLTLYNTTYKYGVTYTKTAK